ncbi:TFIIH subunit [Dictyostelium purpureum]|uniref:General transcription factor IIH subunit n=1 Tax=Dictyostelium purpureum TaxID=5786 RepID=F0ZRU7_DICPU|nr:TFIIH subunit [Dictyostelium purpureum]EGC33332.1 TFIIH subunit [Dictyostelium purpureum]|eukprot:XP_003290148.1 TFIIH subunit [Dictyostelium purpureum]
MSRGTNNSSALNKRINKSLFDEEDGPVHVLQVGDEDGKSKYKWEKELEKSWLDIREDEHGLRVSVEKERSNRNRRLKSTNIDIQRVRRGMQRHLCLVLDLSKTLANQDLKPSRYQVLIQNTEQFIKEFFDQNPISQLSIIITKNSKAEKISELSGNPQRHIQAMKDAIAMEGEPSIQNSLDVAISSLCYVPKYGSREVLFLFSSLTTCDPTDLAKTIQTLKQENIRVSFIHLAAELYICRHIAEQTNGTSKVILNEEHFLENLYSKCQPPPTIGKVEAALVEMGFPQQITSSVPSTCICHEKMKYSGYICPRCGVKSCELPTDCQICNLSLVSSPHLARSYHHLFPIPLFEEVNWKELNTNVTCYSCLTSSETSILSLFFSCPRCDQVFCLECDMYIHEALHNCPGCENNLNTINNHNNNNGH